MKKIISTVLVVALALSMFSCLNPEEQPAEAIAAGTAVLTAVGTAHAAEVLGEAVSGISEALTGEKTKKTINVTDKAEAAGTTTYTVNCNKHFSGTATLTGTIFVTSHDGTGAGGKIGFSIDAPGLIVKIGDNTYLGVHVVCKSEAKLGQSVDKSKVQITVNEKGVK